MKKALIGYGGHANEVMLQIGENLTCFVDDEYVTKNTKCISQLSPDEWEVMICIGDPNIRQKIVNKLPKNIKYFTFVHPTAIIGKDVVIGHGSFIGAFSVVTTNVKIGEHSILNRACHIGHDSVVGDFLSMMPGSIISGNVTIGDRVYIGTNSSIKEKINICDDVIIGLNSGVIKTINKFGVYGGTPVKKIK
jgi:sugar O-acyltransferase (sialic acid O-acetyltransferase NeuD family)